MARGKNKSKKSTGNIIGNVNGNVPSSRTEPPIPVCLLIASLIQGPTPAPAPPRPTTSTLAPPPSQTPVFELKEIAGKGMGVVATEDLEAGTLVLREEPIVVWKEEDGTSKLESLVSALPNDQRAEYYSLYISPEAEKMKKSVGVFTTNALQLGRHTSKAGVFLKGSRFNHSCKPNVQRHYDEEQGVECFCP